MRFCLKYFFIETNCLNVFWPRIFDQTMYFLCKRLLTIVNERSLWTVVNKGSSLTVVIERSFSSTVVLKNDRYVFWFFFVVFKTKRSFFNKSGNDPSVIVSRKCRSRNWRSLEINSTVPLNRIKEPRCWIKKNGRDM